MSARRISSAALALAWLTTFFVLCAPTVARADSGFYESSFGEPADIGAWSISSGQWEVTNGRFIHGSSGSTEIATVHVYGAGSDAAPIMDGDFALDVYASIRSTAVDARAGVVFNFSDPDNYYVLLFSAAGQVQLNSVIGGVVTPIATGSFIPLGVRKWTHIRLVRSNDTTTVRMDGKPVIASVRQEGLPDGQTGLIADRTTAHFDDFSALRADWQASSQFMVDAPYLEDFGDHVADRWQAASGTWTAAPGEYRSTSGGQTAITVSEIPTIIRVIEQREWIYTVKTRMKNGYRGSGNLVGLITSYSSPEGYTELVFSPRGEVRFNSVNGGVASTFASATYVGGGPNVWFDVEFAYIEREEGRPPLAYVRVNGRPVFEALPLPHFMRSVGFVTHWALASFDDVRATQNVFQPYAADFQGEPRIVETNWEVRDNTLNGLAVSETQGLGLGPWRELMDIDFRAWMVNDYGGAGNLVGLFYGSSGSGKPEDSNYFEVVFSPTGVARLNRSLKGQTTTVATANYQGGGAHRWFNVQLLQRQSYVTVRVNGVTLFDNVYQPDAQIGGLGVITHWSVARFDDISLMQAPR